MNWWGGSPSVLLEKKGLSPNERTGTKSLDANIKWLLNGEIGAVGVETKLSCPGHTQLVNSIGTSFDIELARTRASTGSGAGQGGPVEDEVGKSWLKGVSKDDLYFIHNRYTMPNILNQGLARHQ